MRGQTRYFCSLLLLLYAGMLAAQSPVSITDFGAQAGNSVNNAAFIQKAIDQVAAKGKGTVRIPAGRFVSGPIFLKSGITLLLEEGAILAGSVNRMDYGFAAQLSLINGYGLRDIHITGKGTIDGQGRELVQDIYRRLKTGEITDPDWKTKRPAEQNRTHLIYFQECAGITVSGVTLRDASTWVSDFVRCRDLLIEHIRIESMAYWNNDGIDLVDCRNVLIRNCDINSSDDGICLKSEQADAFCDSITVEHCRIRSSANAFKTGTASKGGFRNIKVNGLTVYDTYRSAIALEAVDGGFLENVEISNINATNTGNAVFLKLGHRNTDERYSVIRNIVLKNINVVVPAGKPDAGYETEGPLLKYPPGFRKQAGKIESISPWNYSYPDSTAVIYKHNVFPCSISGLPGHPVENIVLDNIRIIYEGGGDTAINLMPVDSLHIITEAAAAYPEFSMFGELPAWGLYLRHAKNIQCRNMVLIQKKADYRAACIFDEVDGLLLDKLSLKGKFPAPAIVLNQVKTIVMKKIGTPFPEPKAIRKQ